MQILNAKENDLVIISRCHKQAFPRSFASALGMRFLLKNFQWYLQHPDTFLLVAKNTDGQVLGYAGGLLIHQASVYGSSTSIMQFTFKEAIQAILIRPWLIFHPEILSNYPLILKNIRLKLLSEKKPINSSRQHQKKLRSLGLVVIGTSHIARRKGIGSALLQAFEDKGKQLKAERLHLSVKIDNAEAIRAYIRNGWIRGVLHGNNMEMYKLL